MTRPGCGCGCERLNLPSQQGCRKPSGAFQDTRGGGLTAEIFAEASQSSVRCVRSQPLPSGTVGKSEREGVRAETGAGLSAGQGFRAHCALKLRFIPAFFFFF